MIFTLKIRSFFEMPHRKPAFCFVILASRRVAYIINDFQIIFLRIKLPDSSIKVLLINFQLLPGHSPSSLKHFGVKTLHLIPEGPNLVETANFCFSPWISNSYFQKNVLVLIRQCLDKTIINR